jgi:peptidoglycan/LPS O-acetylase OafA/YrhL
MNGTRNSGFLGDLEGLRAIAVLAVLIFHIDKNILPGGFLGVDLFFVISGYVVSKVLISRGVKGQLLDFYLNRFHRLIPASAVTILATIVLFEIFASQLTGGDFYTSALSAIFSFSNINFFLTSGYWSDELSVNPFLHFWSLSVEEQFYLIWPAILYILVIRSPQHALKALTVLLILSVSLLYAIDATQPSASFYLMPSRIFQFSAGALAFCLSAKSFHIYLRESSFIVGILSFVAVVCLINGERASIFVSMIVPTMASFLILFGLQTRISNFILSGSLFRYIGRISFSLYLVHWPIIILLTINYGSTLFSQSAAILLSFSCAYLLHEKIEKKYRLHKIKNIHGHSFWPKRKSYINLGLFSSSVVAIIIGIYASTTTTPIKSENAHYLKTDYVTSVHGIDARTINTTYREFMAPLWDDRTRLGGGCILGHKAPYSSYNWKDCVAKNNTKKILILGDSVVPEIKIMLEQLFKKENIIAVGGSGCLPLYPEADNSRIWEGCQELNRKRFDLIFREDISAIVIASNWRWWQKSQIDSTFKHLKSSGKPIIMIGSRPVFSTRISTVLDTKNGRLAADNLNSYLEYNPHERDIELKKILFKEDRKVTFIDIIDYLCPNKTCVAFTNKGALIYLDHFHITADTAISIGHKLKMDIGNKIANLTGIELKNYDAPHSKTGHSNLKANLKSDNKDIWTCQTYEQGRLKGESKYKLSTDLDLEKCLEGKSILLGDSWGPAAAKILFSSYGVNNVATLNSAGCRPAPPREAMSRFADCYRMNVLRFDMSLLSKYEHIFIATNWNNWTESELERLIAFFKHSSTTVYLFSPRPTFIVPVPTVITKNDKGLLQATDISNYENKASKINRQFLLSRVSVIENIQVIDWYTPLTVKGKLMSLTPDGDQIYRDKHHLTPAGRSFLAEKLSDQIIKLN